MSGTVESTEAQASDATAAGAAVTAQQASAALAAPAAERAACLNCGATLTGAFCAACGQKADVHRSLAHAIEEFLHGLTHFDGKLWRTLPLLLWRPGRLTREYVHGRRARYVSPVAMFLLSVFSMFLLFGFLPSPAPDAAQLQVEPAPAPGSVQQIEAEVREIASAMLAAKGDPARTDELHRLGLARNALLDQLARAAEHPSLRDVVAQAGRTGVLTLRVGREAMHFTAPTALSNPEFVLYKMKQKGYKLSFLLVPLLLPWLILLFARKPGVRVYDHVVLLLYAISAISVLLFIAALLASYATLPAAVYWVLLGVLPVAHVVAQLKEAYALGWAATVWRAGVLSVLGALTFLAYLVGILYLGLYN